MRKAALILTLAMLFAGGGLAGQGKGKGPRKGGRAAVVEIRFAQPEVALIREYYDAHPSELPPGLQKKLARTGTLPPGWQKKLRPFPQYVERRLPPHCDYCGRGVIDGYGVIYDKRTRIILDAIQLAGDIMR